MFPKISAPLAKDIRTGEGIAEWLLGVASVLLGATGDLSIAKSATYATIAVAIKGARRGLVKIAAIQKGVGLDAPEQPRTLTRVESDIETVLANVSAATVQDRAEKPESAATPDSEPVVAVAPITGAVV